jgi:hypothetical protein
LQTSRLHLLGYFAYLAAFQFFLAGDAMTRPRHGLKTLVIDVFTAGDTLSEASLPDTIQSAFHHLEDLAFLVTLMEEKFLAVGIGGLIHNILRNFAVGITTGLLLAGHNRTQLALALL